jgi:predicted Ser/Thr protein kinase
MFQPHALLKRRYRIGGRLGEGGMAIVYLGHDLQSGRDVAIKTLRTQYAADAAFRARFARESRAATSLSHPNIIDVHDVGEENGVPFLVMELVRGQTLKEIIAAEAPFHPQDVAELLEQVASALDYAHSRGYVHRDVKPGNILVDEHGRARVVDFGIAKGLGDSDLTDTGEGLGTVGYLAPEQAEGLMATPVSDVYSLGIVAFEMLTGQLPFRAETPIGVVMQHINDSPPPPSRVLAGIPAPVDQIVLRALEKDPTRRWPSAGAFAQALRNQHGGDPNRRRVAPQDAATAPKSSLALTVIVVALVVAALAALLWTGFGGFPGNGPDPTPTTVVPIAPVITGAIDPSEATSLAEDPGITSAVEPTAPPVQVPSVALEAAPTIAPVAQQAIVVPNLEGLTIAGATAALLPRGLRIALDQPSFSKTIPLNAVVAQDPPPGTSVSAGTTIRVSLSRGPSPFGDDTQP